MKCKKLRRIKPQCLFALGSFLFGLPERSVQGSGAYYLLWRLIVEIDFKESLNDVEMKGMRGLKTVKRLCCR